MGHEFDFDFDAHPEIDRSKLIPRPEHRTSEAEMRENHKRLMLTLSHAVDPTTGWVPTTQELAEIFHYHPRTVTRFLREAGQFKYPRPEVRREALPENEQAFFMGLGLGDFQISHSHWGREGFVVVATESPKERKRKLLASTLGTWGEVRNSEDELRVYVASPDFDFMEKPPVTPKFLDARSRFAPFLLGMMTARLSDKENRLSLPNPDLLARIHRRFDDHFGFSLGNYRVEERASHNGQLHVQQLPVVEVRNPGEVFSALVSTPAVPSLPFFSNVAKL